MKKSYLLTALACLLAPVLSYAGTLKGKVTDTKGEELPFAIVYVQGTTNGTNANADADYSLSLQPGSYKIVCQIIGFTQSSYNVTIKGDETITHNFKLAEQNLELKAVTVKAGEDPAYGIMRKVIARRKFHLKQVKSFQSSIYLKGVFRNRIMPNSIFGLMKEEDGQLAKKEMGLDSAGRGILYLCEEEADYYSQEPNKERTVIRSVKQSGNPNGMGLERMPAVVTFYDNNVNPFQGSSSRGFISPVSDNALLYYKFKYLGDYQENGYTIDKIQVTPRRLYEPLFTGVIYIAEKDWAIHSLNLLITKTANLETLDTLRIQQSHLPLKEDTWVIKSQLLYPTISLLGFDISGYFMTVYNNQKVNEPIPDSIFANKKITSEYDKGANKKDSTYWQESRPVPLEADEVKDYVVKDSLNEHLNSPAYIDSMRRVYNKFKITNLLTGGVRYNSKMYKNKYRSNALLSLYNPLVSFNTVEGVAVAPKVWWSHEVDSYAHINATIAARYGFSNERFNAIGKVAYRQDDRAWKGKYWELGVQGGRYIFQLNPQSTIFPLYNTFSTLVYAQNYMKLYERTDGTLFFERNHGNGLSWKVNMSYQERKPLVNTTGYSWAKDAETKFTANNPIVPTTLGWTPHSAAIVGLSLSYQPGYTYTMYPDYRDPNRSSWPVFTLGYTKGIPDLLNSSVDYDKWRFDITDELNMKMAGILSYNIAAGGFINNKAVAIPDMKHFSDNQYTLAAPYLQSFQMMPYFRYSNTESVYGELHLEYYLKGLLTNKIPLLRQAQWYFVLGTNSFYASEKNYYSEAFAGIDNLGYKWMRFLRVDVVHSWNSLNQSALGVRIGIKPSGMIRVSVGEDHKGEW
jgi:hypothetical protein